MIQGSNPNTEIWLGDDLGWHVQTETGTLETRLLPGNYTVEFGLGTAQYPIKLQRDCRCTQAALEKGPTCVRRIPALSDD